MQDADFATFTRCLSIFDGGYPPGCVCAVACHCQNTLQAVSRLLSGELTHITLSEHCLRQDGTAGYFSVEMNCLWKHNKAHCIVCFIRPAQEGVQVGTGGSCPLVS